MFRITKKERGYVVEVKKYRLGLFPYWTWYIPVAGLNRPRHFLSYESALKDLLEKIEWDLTDTTNTEQSE